MNRPTDPIDAAQLLYEYILEPDASSLEQIRCICDGNVETLRSLLKEILPIDETPNGPDQDILDLLGRFNFASLAEITPPESEARDVAKKFGLKYSKVQGVILPPDKSKKSNLPTNGGDDSKRSEKTDAELARELDRAMAEAGKLDELCRMLLTHRTETGDCLLTRADIEIQEGDKPTDIYRKSSYILVVIKPLQTVVFVNPNEATFIAGLEYAEADKYQQEKSVVDGDLLKISFDYSDAQNWLDRIANRLFENSPEKIRVREAVLSEHTPESFMSMTGDERTKFQVDGKQILSIASVFFTTKHSLRPHKSNRDLATIAQAIFGEGHDVIDAELLDQDGWIAEIKSMYPTAEEFMQLKNRDTIKIKGKTLKFIAGKVVPERREGMDINKSNSDFANFARVVYGAGNECIEVHTCDNEQFARYFFNAHPSPQFLADATAAERAGFTFHGIGFNSIITRILGGTPSKASGFTVAMVRNLWAQRDRFFLQAGE